MIKAGETSLHRSVGEGKRCPFLRQGKQASALQMKSREHKNKGGPDKGGRTANIAHPDPMRGWLPFRPEQKPR